MREKFVAFARRETVLCIAAALAVASMCLVKPNAGYLGYLNLHTLGMLWTLMLVMAGLRQLGLFDRLGRALLRRVKSTRQLALTLVLLPFFTSMFITNDVALLTFAPFALEVLALSGQTGLLVPVLVLQTLAANLGSMLTPLGNPQNLFLYAQSGMALGQFLLLMLPYTLLSLALCVAGCCLVKKRGLSIAPAGAAAPLPRGLPALYGGLFGLCLLAVAGVIPYYLALAPTLALLLVFDRRVLPRANYALLVTFICFFVLIGNLGQIAAVRELIAAVIAGRETLVAVLCSQVMSNVPAAILLAGFSDAWEALIVGVNVGGLGTLIASMASLITYQLLAAEHPELKGRYFTRFTLANVACLLPLGLLAWAL